MKSVCVCMCVEGVGVAGGEGRSACILQMKEESTQELFSCLEDWYPCDCISSHGIQGGLVLRLHQSFALILRVCSGQLSGMGQANSSIKT